MTKAELFFAPGGPLSCLGHLGLRGRSRLGDGCPEGKPVKGAVTEGAVETGSRRDVK